MNRACTVVRQPRPVLAGLFLGLLFLAGLSAQGQQSRIFQLQRGAKTSLQPSPLGSDTIGSPEFDILEGGDLEDLQGFSGGKTVNRSFATSESQGDFSDDHHKSKSNPQILTSFQGVNFHSQRFANGGNQFSVEPPDQGLCAGNGFVLDTVNDVLNVYDTNGNPLLSAPQDLNTFYGYPAAINRSAHPLTFGPSITDPSCYFDPDTQRWFHVVLTLDRAAPTTRALSGRNHLDIAVSNSPSPLGTWTVYTLPVQDDGTEGTPDHGCQARVPNPNGTGTILVHGPCLGDYPHIGADANGFYITTNEFSLFGPGFFGSQIYALSKRALARGDAVIGVVQFDTNGQGPDGIGFTVWPATGAARGDSDNHGDDRGNDNGNRGIEYFLSSDAVFFASGTSNNLLVWALSNTSSLNSGSPALTLTAGLVGVNTYGVPPKAKQKAGSTPLATCVGILFCANAVGGTFQANAPEGFLDSNDSRMQQVFFANGKLWGALDTAVMVGGQNRAGIAYFILRPEFSDGSLSADVRMQGTLAVAQTDLTYPSVASLDSGRGVVSFTLTGDNDYPSVAYASLDPRAGAGDVHVALAGVGPQDGFTEYLAFAPPFRPRWGDYGAAAVDGHTIWFAQEYIAQTCSFSDYLSAPFGTCGGTRGALGNWATGVVHVKLK